MGFELLTILLETCIWKSFGSVKVDENCLMGFPMTISHGFKPIYLLGVILINGTRKGFGSFKIYTSLIFFFLGPCFLFLFLLYFGNKARRIMFNLVEL